MQAAAVFTGGQALGQVFGGISKYKQAKSQANAMKRDAFNQGTGAIETDSIRREEMRETLAAIATSRAANGLSSTSVTGTAIRKGVSRTMTRDRRIEVANQNRRAQATLRSAKIRAAAGRSALMGSFLGAGTTIAGGLT